jgi:RHH-type proline utilization regulon transcriptional repressor/proline dehydrogenase/delta 1-pyrroline-5-carboxylate dehydrogenase
VDASSDAFEIETRRPMSATHAPGPHANLRDRIERRTRELGREIFDRIGRGPRIWQRAWWDDRLMGLSMGDEATKIQLFRFVDALPTLTTDSAIRRHLQEYLEEAGDGVPWIVALPLVLTPRGRLGDRLIARIARTGAHRMARRFIAGSNPAEALKTILTLRRQGMGFTADLLGEAIISESESDAYQSTCLDLLQNLAGPLTRAAEIPQIDRDDHGPIPRLNLSLKLTSLTSRFDPIDPGATRDRVAARLRPILTTARALGAHVHIDMEQYAFKDLTYEIFRSVLEEPEFRDWPNVGIVGQAYLPETLADLQSLRDWAERRGAPITVRLVKGAYWDYEVTHSRQNGWPIPVFQQKWQSDAQFERCARYLMQNQAWLRPALGSHNVRSLAHALAAAEAFGVPAQAFEVQTLYGMGDALQQAFVERGNRVRVYTPYGAILPGMAYLVRRLLENTSNESFLLASTSSDVPVAELLQNPEEIGAMRIRSRQSAAPTPEGPSLVPPPFRNEPPTDFSRPELREAMHSAIEEVREKLGVEVPLFIAGQESRSNRSLDSLDPGNTARVVARASMASSAGADRALEALTRAAPAWAATPASRRASVLLRAAEIMRQRKFQLAAWEIFECAKPWREADADVAEAIDFCEFYAREMLRLDQPEHRDVPGETNALSYAARGVAVVIPPWNFPLAIPCGMTVAALVTGNPVALKPAEQAPMMSWLLVSALLEAGLPRDVISFLPGLGEEVGQALVNDPRVALIAFTGSRQVGLLIIRQAAATPQGQDHVKRVITEMGGKNAIIVDDDADLDEAVLGVVHSAFNYAGQKCSACSRAIVLEGVYDAFLSRLVEAARALGIGAADDPDTDIPAVIDAEARRRVEMYRELAPSEGRIALHVDVPELAKQGNYVGPLIVADVSPASRLAQEEIFGPVLAVLRAYDLTKALEIANGTEYALTGGVYSRSPANIDRVAREFRVGNLYVNRTITGALVNRQPFGGFKLSGTGTKAGGPDYLREFLLPRTITENTMRRGFAPEPEADEPAHPRHAGRALTVPAR